MVNPKLTMAGYFSKNTVSNATIICHFTILYNKLTVMYKTTKKFVDQLAYEIIGAAIEVHKQIGPGLLESVYHVCMKEELKQREIPFVSEMK